MRLDYIIALIYPTQRPIQSVFKKKIKNYLHDL